ncbi:MAG: hypothetical protein R3279_03645 [Putridiphycobacter sp.]|nr:hypothetical protein [Putridiphycobacter sp.]
MKKEIYLIILSALAFIACKKDFQCACIKTTKISELMTVDISIDSSIFSVEARPNEAEATCTGYNLYNTTPDLKNSVEISCELVK